MRRKLWLMIGLTLPLVSLARAQEHALTLSLEDFTTRAIKQGVEGQENALLFESAGYTREVAFRQTDSPTLTATGSSIRQGTEGTIPNSVIDTHQAGITLSEQLPIGTRLNVQADTLGTHGVSGVGAHSNSQQKVVSATASQPIYLFVKNAVFRTRRQADLAFANAQDAYESNLLALRARAHSFYYQVMLGEESIKVEERKAESSRKLLDITAALVKGGKTAPVESMRAKVRVQDDERQLQNAIVTHAKAVLSAKNFIYVPLEEDVFFSTRLEFKPFSISLGRLTTYAVVHNPQLKTLRRQHELAVLDLQATRETTRPTLSLDSSYNYVEVAPSLSKQWTLGASANWRFFDSFITRDNVSKARIGVLIADLNLSEAERTTRLNIQNAFLDLKNAEKQIQDFVSTIEQSRRNVEVVRLRFRNGLERLIDVFDAENDMRNLDQEYINLLVSFNQQKDTLSQQVGADVESIP